MAFPNNWGFIGDGFSYRNTESPIEGSASLFLQTSAENKIQTAYPTGSLQHGFLGAQYRFNVNIMSGTGASAFIRSGLCFMCSSNNLIVGPQNFYYTGMRLNADTGGNHNLFLRKVINGTLYDVGTIIGGPIAGEQTGYNKTYAIEVYWRISGANLRIKISMGLQQDYSDLIEKINVVDTSPILTSTNEIFYIRSETGVTSSLSHIDLVDVSLVL